MGQVFLLQGRELKKEILHFTLILLIVGCDLKINKNNSKLVVFYYIYNKESSITYHFVNDGVVM